MKTEYKVKRSYKEGYQIAETEYGQHTVIKPNGSEGGTYETYTEAREAIDNNEE